MGHQFLSCGFVCLPCPLGARVIDLRDRDTSGGGFLEGFEPGNIDRKERHALGSQCTTKLASFRLWGWGTLVNSTR